MVRRVVPKCVSGTQPQGFYDKEKDVDDVGSVRRYRISLEDDEVVVDEKKRMLPKKKKDGGKKRRWFCF